MKLRIALLLALTMNLVACGFGDDSGTPSPSAPESIGSRSDAAEAEPILGTWRRENTCEELVRAFMAVDIEEDLPWWIVRMSLRDDPRNVVAQDENMCRGAKPVERTQILRPNGYLTRYQGDRIVDDCRCYALVGDDILVVLGDPGDPDISTRYTIRGDTVRFEVVIPDPCSTESCRDQIAFAIMQYGLGPWERA